MITLETVGTNDPSSRRLISSKGTRSKLAGLWGEVLAEEIVDQLGWKVHQEESGGYRKGSDFWAQHSETRKWLVAQVKATTKPYGHINWGKPGEEGVKSLLAKANRWEAHAIFVLLHLEPSDAHLEASRIVVTRPKVLNITGCTAREWAIAVDKSRAAYASKPYKIGPKRGEMRPESGALHPCCVDDFLPFADFMASLPF
jgi:hypothetical protein